LGSMASRVSAPDPDPEIRPVNQLSAHRQLKLAISRVAIVLASVFTIRYFFWRALHTMNPAAKIFFYAFLVAEGLSFLESLLFYFIAWNPTRYKRPEALPGRTVDVFIPTYNEPAELLRETVLCAVNMKYPHKTYILDDGQRDAVRELATEFDCGYIARGDRAHAKAGNLNNALAQTSGEFIVTLDADHVAAPELIEDTIGFFIDPSVAVVQGTQDFYNLDSFQHRINWASRAGWQQQELFFSVIQPGKDRHNATFYCGSPGILRRAALEEIGGFPTGTITEDMHTSLRLQKKGWRVLYFNRSLARGLAPQTFTGFATQWQRWGHGSMQVLRTENPFFTGKLSLAQKICYFSSFYFYWMSWVKLFFVLTPIIALLLAVFPLVTDPVSYASNFLPYFLLNLACSVLLQGGVRNFLRSEQFNLLKMHVLMRTMAGLFQKESLFFVTPKARAAAARASEVLLPLILMLGLVLALGAGIVRIQMVAWGGYEFWALAVNIFWAVVFLVMMGGVVRRSLVHKEQRVAYRFPTRQPVPMLVSYTGADGASVSSEQLARNLNRSGVSMTPEKGIEPGTEVHIALSLPGHMVEATGKVVNKQTNRVNGKPRVSNGIRFEQIAAADQDEISKYLFWQIAPQEGEVLSMTHASQVELVAQPAPQEVPEAGLAKAGPATAKAETAKKAKAGGES
jgi:cellulose synthase/poly-beta-1,6-N-acetylglucosamine synthase-like glycosyltransferase